MIKRFLIAFVLLVIVCGGLVGFNLFRDRAIQQYFASMPRPASTVSTVTAEPKRWTPGIEAIGTVSARQGVDLTVETTGIVREILFKANDKVHAGGILVQLDDEVERADLEAAKAQAVLAKTALSRALELQKKGVGSDVVLDTAQAAATAASAQVNKLQAVLDQKQLTAPFSGTVGIPRIDIGQYIAPGTMAVTLQDLDTLRVDFTVPEQQLAMLKIGQTIALGTSDEEMPFQGKIIGIDPKIDPVTRLVSVRGEVANPGGQLSPGQFVRVRVELPAENNILALPQTALVTSLYGDFIYVVKPAPPKPAEAGKPAAAAKPANGAADKPQLVVAQVFVKAGRRSEGQVEILSGLAAGDEVVTAGQNRLSNGAPVVVDNSVQPADSDEQRAAQR